MDRAPEEPSAMLDRAIQELKQTVLAAKDMADKRGQLLARFRDKAADDHKRIAGLQRELREARAEIARLKGTEDA